MFHSHITNENVVSRPFGQKHKNNVERWVSHFKMMNLVVKFTFTGVMLLQRYENKLSYSVLNYASTLGGFLKFWL